ncbi:carbon-nitrogen hydrolase family protein [Gulosibacter bifidus]|uniref:Carbon-nitrogen hydrolase family protein n=1 Tax=Gulosibacter bifidus TaxID=272239 RepID=A0ABW5RIF9_9MICO|nr:carbon-nitrogen hydrolase family protein [Gulosibacter bifidus]
MTDETVTESMTATATAAKGTLRVAAAQLAPLPIGAAIAPFAEQLARIVAEHRPDLVIFPELHCFGADDSDLQRQNARLRAGAVTIDEFVDAVGPIVRQHGVWCVPGSIVERGTDGEVFNTQVVIDPQGRERCRYRKVFPWRPTEPYAPGDAFAVCTMTDDPANAAPGSTPVLGMSICYDAWWPEVTRHLAWLGAEVVCNVVKTTTPDRDQEVILARANSIVNQNFTCSVNVAGPLGGGKSLIVGPEGEVLAESTNASECILVAELDLDRVAQVRQHGTCGSVVPWQQFQDADAPISMPLYGGELAPRNWAPGGRRYR